MLDFPLEVHPIDTRQQKNWGQIAKFKNSDNLVKLKVKSKVKEALQIFL